MRISLRLPARLPFTYHKHEPFTLCRANTALPSQDRILRVLNVFSKSPKCSLSSSPRAAAMNRERSTYTSASNDTSSVRPRNRRLISYGDEGDTAYEDVGSSTSWSQSTSKAHYPSRGVSPIPGAHPSRPPSSTPNAGSVTNSGYGWGRIDRGQTNASPGFGLWESWSSIQGIASTLLGSDAQQPTKGNSDGGFNVYGWRKPGKVSDLRPPTPQWGPDIHSGHNVTAGSKEERQALVQAKRREALLLADVNRFPSSITAHKRRDSDLRVSSSATSAEQDGDALVYVHRVKPQDTLAGVMIRYQCQPAVFRKVNRLWPNDNIQIREQVFLPVEACAIRGRKIGAEISTTNYKNPNSSLSEQSTHTINNHTDLPAANVSPSVFPTPTPDADPEYKHEYFVSLPHIPESVEIARIPRRTLGFFPPSRRKSQTLSDMDPYSDSPKTSLDLTSRLNSMSLNASPSRDRRGRPHRSGSGSYFVDRLKGPGGVGTLRGSGPAGRGLVTPGPAEDSLNKMFAHHLPNVAPRESFDSVHSTSSTGLENVGGVIEGWVRKVGTRITGVVGSEEAYRQQGRGRLRMGDLIELENSGDTVEDRDRDQEGFGAGVEQGHHEGVLGGGGGGAFDGPATGSGRSSRDLLKRRGSANAATGSGSGGVTATEEALLRERFPPRGRMVGAQTKGRR